MTTILEQFAVHVEVLGDYIPTDHNGDAYVTETNLKLLRAALGVCGEAGELGEKVKKYVFQGHTLNTFECVTEAGDILWYIESLLSVLGYSLEDAMSANIVKLQKRYPGGVFTDTHSINREEYTKDTEF
jgi:NTP pyrophosphatase (non-canonical NTP hydrolase)